MLKSIFQRQCPKIAEIFSAAGSLDKILIASFDFAKDKHLSLFCNGRGDQLLKPFTVHNNREGFDYFLERIIVTCKRHGIQRQHVVIGGEDCPSYALNLLWALHQQQDLCVVRVNAWKAKKQRENVQASTDKLDLLGVAKTIINRDAYPVFDANFDIDAQFRDYEAMRELGRTRDALVKTKTAISNRIHNVVKVLFPNFLDGGKDNPITPFSKTSLALMDRKDFHSAAYSRKNIAPLARRLQSHGVREPVEKAHKLIERSKNALPPCPQSIDCRHQCLSALIASYRNLDELCLQLELQQAQALARTPAAVLTSVSGVGIVSASAIGGEQGHVDQLGPLPHLASYAGIVPGIDQTGGPDCPAKTKKVKPRCNRRLKKHLVHTVNHMGTALGPPEFRADYDGLMANGQHADFVMARRFLRTAKYLMKNQVVYLPPHARGSDRETLCEYLQEYWPKLRAKWRTLKALDAAFASNAPLGLWRAMMESVYGIDLPLERTGEVRLRELKEEDLAVCAQS